MHFFKDANFDIVSKQKYVLISSLVLITISAILMFSNGIRKGIDFNGGAQIILQFDNNVEIATVRSILAEAGYKDAETKSYGINKVSIMIQAADDIENSALTSEIKNSFVGKMGDTKLLGTSIQRVSGKMSSEMVSRSAEAVEFALVLICLYIIIRFSARHTIWAILGFIIDYAFYSFLFKGTIGFFIPIFVLYPIIFKSGFAFGALVATVHDVVLTLAFLQIFNIEFSGAVIAALLTIIGYSINDTVIVFDRIRENLSEVKIIEFNEKDFNDIINKSINTTLSRTVITSLTTFFVTFVLSLVGGESLFAFAFTMSIGIIIGTYSSIFVAAPIMMNRYVSEMNDLRIKEEAELAAGVDKQSNKDKILV